MPAKKNKRQSAKKTPRKKRATKKVAKKTAEDILNENKNQEPAPVVTMEPTENDFKDSEGEPEAEDYSPYKPGWAKKYQTEHEVIITENVPTPKAPVIAVKEKPIDPIRILKDIIDAAEFMIKRLKPRSYQKVETPDLIKQRISQTKKLLKKLEDEKE
jgi:hypothetical protein